MGEETSRLAAAGWYDDPAGSGGQRYWDGGGWTSETRVHPTNDPPETRKPTRRAALLVGAFAAVLAVGVGVGLVVAGETTGDPDTPSVPEEPDTSDSGVDGLASSLGLVAEVDRPTDLSEAVQFTDIEALRAAGVVSRPAADGDGWSTARQIDDTGTMPVWFPYLPFMQLHRAVPMEHVVGLAYDEIAVAVGVHRQVDGWFVPDDGEVAVRERLRSSPVWEQIGPGTFDRVGDFTAEILGGYEPDSVGQRLLDQQPQRVEVHGGAIRLDMGELTRRGDPLGDDPAWSALLDQLAIQGAVSGLLLPHEELQPVPEGGTPLQPAAAVALASVIEGGSISDLLVLEYGDPAAAATNADVARTNLELIAGSGYADGEVRVDATTVLVRLHLTGDGTGTSDLFRTMQRFPHGPLGQIIGTGDADAADAEASPEQTPGSTSLAGASITVASKDFDEQLILGEISVALLRDAGAEVDDRGALGGTDATRSALTSGEIDHYWEYTGTAWLFFYGETEPISDRIALYEAVRDREAAERGLFWLEPTMSDNTYAIALSRSTDAQLGGIDTISELGALLRSDPAAATLCVESDFHARNDGLPGLEAHYGADFPDANVTVLDTGAIYVAIADRAPCSFGEVFATDGRVAALDLKLLEDDRAFFPIYNAAPVFVGDVWADHGRTLQELYAPVAAALDNDTMQTLNARVGRGERPADVAVDWLTEGGFID